MTIEGLRDGVRVELADGIATISIERPERRNALSIAANARLGEAWRFVDETDAVRVAILTSADCGTFCAGMDLREAAELRREKGVDVLELVEDPFFEFMRTMAKPIVCAMTGHLMAGGMLLSLNADLRVGLAGTRAAITEVKVGRGSPWAVPLLWMLPEPIVSELVLTGEPMPIERLHQLGFVNHVEATPDAVREKALALATSIRDAAPLSVLAGKESLKRATSLGCAAGLEAAKQRYEVVYASEDAIEGPRAFAEKRAPQWKGR